MRQAGTLSDRQDAELFLDHLMVLGIEGQLDDADEDWVVWVYDEDQVERAKEELDRFRKNKNDPGYRHAQEVAQDLRQEAARKQKVQQKKVINVRERWSRGLMQRAPATFALITICVTVAILTSLGRNEDTVDPLRIVSLRHEGPRVFWFDGLQEIRSGQIWRLFTPIFLHFGPLHLLFNMYWLYNLGGIIEYVRGTRRFLLMVVAMAVVSNLAQYPVWGDILTALGVEHRQFSPNFGGMSGVVYGLFGYVWMKGRLEPRLGLALHPNLVLFMLAWLVLAMTGVFGSIANVAHVAGLLVGVALGAANTLLAKLRT